MMIYYVDDDIDSMIEWFLNICTDWHIYISSIDLKKKLESWKNCILL